MPESSRTSDYDRRYGRVADFRKDAPANALPVHPVHHNGLLIEGVDYSGKTSVCDEIERILLEGDQDIFRNACFLHNHPIIKALLAQAKRSDDLAGRDVCYTASLLLDLTLTKPLRPGCYRIQERHVLTQIGRNSYFYDAPEAWHIDTMRQLRPRFSCQVYLTSDLAAKTARTRSRPAKSPRDALLAADPGLHQHYDDAMRASLPPDEGWCVIDTSQMRVKDVADAVLAEVWRSDSGQFGRHIRRGGAVNSDLTHVMSEEL